MKGRSALTQAYLKECVWYIPESGLFLWRLRPARHFATSRAQAAWNAKMAGKVAGSVMAPTHRNRSPYLRIVLDRRSYFGHQLAWLYMHGSLPAEQIDHKNQNTLDNSIDNLRLATPFINTTNRRLNSRSKTGIHGVYMPKGRSRWVVGIGHGDSFAHLGCFEDFFDACCARKSAEAARGYNINHGRERHDA